MDDTAIFRDLDAVIVQLGNQGLFKVDPGHEECMPYDQLRDFVIGLVSDKRVDYANTLIGRLKDDHYIRWGVDNHYRKDERFFTFKAATNGYVARALKERAEQKREDDMRDIAHKANLAAIESIGLAKDEAKRSRLYAVLSFIGFLLSLAVAVYTSLVEPIYDPKNSNDPVYQGDTQSTKGGTVPEQGAKHKVGYHSADTLLHDSLVLAGDGKK